MKKLKFQNRTNDSNVEFLAFNYDGKGNALVQYKGKEGVRSLSLEEVNAILFGKGGYVLTKKKKKDKTKISGAAHP